MPEFGTGRLAAEVIWNLFSFDGRVFALMMQNGIQKDGTVSEQWRLQCGYPPFRVDRDRLIGHIFGSIATRKHRTAKIMAAYYRQLFTDNPMALTPLSADDPEGVISRSRR